MANTYIGNPIEVAKEYSERKEYRPLNEMTDEECRIILELATDNGDWKGIAVNHLKIGSRASNFIEGDVSFGKGEALYFSIRYDGTVEIHKIKFDEGKMDFIHTKDRLKVYRFADITFYMMRQGFDLNTHLK